MNNVYPNMKASREDFLRIRLGEAFSDYSSVYPEVNDPEELSIYLEKLQPNFRELFLDVARFVGILYNELDTIPDHLRDAVSLILMFSIIETLQLATKDYVELSHWLQSKKCSEKLDELWKKGMDCKQVLKALSAEYFSTYGSIHAVTDFFEDFLSEPDKRKLIQDYRVRKQCLEQVWEGYLKLGLPSYNPAMTIPQVLSFFNPNFGRGIQSGEAFLPECYCTACYVQYGNCWPSIWCRLNDEDVLRNTLTKVTKRLVYAYRNGFVHNSRLTILAGGTAHVFDYIEDRIILHTLNRDFLLEAFRNALVKFFETGKLD
jgi:hypothetical protein